MNPYEVAPRAKRVRLSVTIPADLNRWVHEQAKTYHVTVSRVVEVALIHAMVESDVGGKS